MDLFAFMKKLGINEEFEVGEKVADLTPEELVTWDILETEGKALREAIDDLQLRCSEHDLQKRKWWRKVEAAHGIDRATQLRCEDAALWELVPPKHND